MALLSAGAGIDSSPLTGTPRKRAIKWTAEVREPVANAITPHKALREHLEERGFDSQQAAAVADVGRAIERFQREIIDSYQRPPTSTIDSYQWTITEEVRSLRRTIWMAVTAMAMATVTMVVALIVFAFVLVAIGNDSQADVGSPDPPPGQEAPLSPGR